MRVTILGSRGNITASALRYARHSGVLIDRDLLLDLGELAYLDYHPKFIFISHLHADHAAFLRTPVELSAELYLPEEAKRFPAAHVISGPVAVGSYRVFPIPTIHSRLNRSFGYVVERNGHRLFYSSDIVEVDARYRRRLRNLDLVITDGSYMRRGGVVRVARATGARYGHAGIPDLVEYFRPFTTRIVVTHFGSWFYKDVAASVRKIEGLSDDGRVLAAYDGMTLTL
jgi:ribonuclease BN (tRNA processing enzyme)